jgi:putative membrane protein
MMGGGFGGTGLGAMFLFWALIIMGALWLLASTFPRPPRDGQWSSFDQEGDFELDESPQDILKRRYASGEIERAEYETMRQDLER